MAGSPEVNHVRSRLVDDLLPRLANAKGEIGILVEGRCVDFIETPETMEELGRDEDGRC